MLAAAIRSFPRQREVEHCGRKFLAGVLDIYADCPTCGTRIKLRSLAAATELEDVFDAVLEWMTDPVARQSAQARLQAIEDDQQLTTSHSITRRKKEDRACDSSG